jgi:hypothetical protein
MFLFGNTVAFWVFETAASWHRKGRWQRAYYRVFAPSKLEGLELQRRTGVADRTPKQLPLRWEFWSIFPLAITYAAARGYLVVETFLGLRSLEPSTFVNVDWSLFIPHI